MIDNLPHLLLDRASARPDLMIGALDDQISLQLALELAAGGAADLQARNLSAEDRVAIVAENSTDYVLAWLSCLLAGVPVALVDQTYPRELLACMLDVLDPTVVISDHPAAPSFAGTRRAILISTFRTAPRLDPSHAPGTNSGRYSTASLMHPARPTPGIPQFCAQSHEYFLRLGRAVAEAMTLTDRDRSLTPLPLSQINSLGHGLVGALTAGADALLGRTIAVDTFWSEAIDHGITALTLDAPLVNNLARTATPKDSAGHRVRTMFPADGAFMRRFGVVRAVSGYGSTEAAGASHLRSWSIDDDIPTDAHRHGGTGREDIEWKLTDSGEILIREAARGALFTGYFTFPGVSSRLDQNGWFHTADHGRLDEDGGLVAVERGLDHSRG
ncbi:AMP-binding protein [Rhodococcus sp. IEGM 1305]|uniref:AMP-binding protein n=1 Tax=Rhodococcus sp. IEGM 1305 TaxID=3047092 RepID=UPI0024B75538|nr:AMP-binding protein [Rhodococcus sp. IEGM 1305]MDI9949602.1 AMP-binding protein [Rhodococcus sp. IEGM 1305]